MTGTLFFLVDIENDPFEVLSQGRHAVSEISAHRHLPPAPRQIDEGMFNDIRGRSPEGGVPKLLLLGEETYACSQPSFEV